MKINFKKSILAVATGLLVSATSFAQFGGSIEFTKKVGNIEVNYKYYVSGNDVRVEEINEGAIEGVQLMDLEAKTMLALSPERKMYMDVPNKRPASELNVEVDKTGKTKTINGVKCQEIIVTCAEKDRKIQYWVADGNYDFFIPMLETLNRKENQSMFYLKIPGMDGKFPMQSTETTLSGGDVVSELSAGKITKKDIEKSMFEVPAGFSKFER